MLVRNIKDRIYDGIRPFQIVEVSEDKAELLLWVGFELIENVDDKTDDNTDAWNHNADDIESRKQFLKAHGVTIGKWKDQTIIDKSNDAWYQSVINTEDPATKTDDNTDAE